MNDRTQRVLIVAAGVVLLGGGALATWNWMGRTFDEGKCPDGRTMRIARPDAFVLRYSGLSAAASLHRAELSADLKLEERVLQTATEATQLLDQRLRLAVLEQNATACEPGGAALWDSLVRYSVDDLVKLREAGARLDRLADGRDAGKRGEAEQQVSEIAATAAAAAERLQRPAETRR